MRDRIWNSLVNVKFKALYACECARKADLCDRLLSVLLALCASASVAAWSVWQQYSRVWALIIGLSQVLLIARPYVPFFKNEAKFLSFSFELESLYLGYKKLWYSFEAGVEKNLIERLDELEAKGLEIEKHGPQFPRVQSWINRADAEKNSALKIDFPKMLVS